MDFSFSSDQQLLKHSARAFLDEHCKPATVRLLWDDPRGESDTMWKEMAQLGWHGLALPEAYGGSGLGMVESAILLEELGRASYPGPYWPTVLAAAAVEAAGNDAQKKRWLSAIATGDARATLAFLDRDLDWDPASVTTRAEKSSKGWALSGTKRFVPWAHVANVLLIPARAGRRVAVPRRSLGGGPQALAGPGHGSGDPLGPSRDGQGAGRLRCRARRARSGRVTPRGSLAPRRRRRGGRDAGRGASMPGHG